MIKSNFYKILFLTFLLTTACDKGFEELNKNPFFPTQVDFGPLFNTVVESLQLGWDEQFYLHNDTYYEITQQAAMTSRFSAINTNGTENVWNNYYTALAHIRELERRFDDYSGNQETLNNVRAQLKIITAYKTFRITDQFGDIPFFDAGKGFEDLKYLRPKFDSQQEIYKFLLEDLEWAVDHIDLNATTPSGDEYISFGNFDTLLDSNLRWWKKFANSLRLRHALRMADKDIAFAGPILKDIIENNLDVIKEGEPVMMYPRKLAWLKESTHWSFREHKSLRMGSNIWHQLSENDNIDGSGIFDPRTYFFFETNNANEWVAYPQIPDANTPPPGGVPYQGHRDGNYSNKGVDNIYSPFIYYLIRDEKDFPEFIMTPAEVHFIKAEAYIRGLGVATNVAAAEAAYTNGVVASISLWQEIVKNTQIWVNAPPEKTINEIYQLVNNHPRISIFSNSNKLELIYTQRWLDAFRQPWEAFALSRRTNATPREGNAPEYYRLAYPPSEVENNPDNWAAQVAKMGGDTPKVKVWWME